MSHHTAYKVSLHLLLGTLCLFATTPALVYLLTLKTSEFEGGKAYAILFLLPVVFIILAIIWFVDYRRHSRSEKAYFLRRGLLFISLIIPISIGFYLYQKKKNQERIELKRNSHACVDQLADEYKGFIIDIKSPTMKIRKRDSAYTEIRYSFETLHNIQTLFYPGQDISKLKGEQEFQVTLKDGEFKRYKIPCYEE